MWPTVGPIDSRVRDIQYRQAKVVFMISFCPNLNNDTHWTGLSQDPRHSQQCLCAQRWHGGYTVWPVTPEEGVVSEKLWLKARLTVTPLCSFTRQHVLTVQGSLLWSTISSSDSNHSFQTNPSRDSVTEVSGSETSRSADVNILPTPHIKAMWTPLSASTARTMLWWHLNTNCFW